MNEEERRFFSKTFAEAFVEIKKQERQKVIEEIKELCKRENIILASTLFYNLEQLEGKEE